MMAAMGPQYSKYLWWKKYLTTLQMIQFVGIFTHAFQVRVAGDERKYGLKISLYVLYT